MKKCGMILTLVLLLTGCGKQQTMETVNDVHVQPTAAVIQQVLIDLPADAVAPVMETEDGKFYICGDCVICLQTFSGGDLQKTIKRVSGFAKEDLDVVQTQWNDTTRYDFVWAAVEETGEQVCRACILDDGHYHYVLTASVAAEQAGQLQGTWREMFDSFRLVSPQMPLDTGS